MKFTNLYGIKSQSVIDALTHNDYDLQDKPKNVFSCTEICDSPKNKVLQRRHLHEACIDVTDNLHSLDGSAVHYALEMSNKNTDAARLSEDRIFIDVTNWTAHTLVGGKPISEQEWYFEDHIYVSFKFDIYEESDFCVEDYKRTSVWEAKKGLKDSRIQQLNINGFGLRLLGFTVKKLRACLFLKDWSSSELRSQEQSARSRGMATNYPLVPYKEFECDVWDDSIVRDFIETRVMLHVRAMHLHDNDIPVCTPDERWYRGESLAIMKVGNQRATKVVDVDEFESREIAIETANELLRVYQQEANDKAVSKSKKPKEPDKYIIEVRPGNDGRCNGEKQYCSICQWCDYWQEKYGHDARGGAGEEF